MSLLIDVVAAGLMIAGLVFFIGATLGLLRFPDFYTRMHAAGKGDTLSTILILLGVAVYISKEVFFEHHWVVLLVMVKILSIAGFIMVTSPTSTHALMRAGYEDADEPDPQIPNKDQGAECLEDRPDHPPVMEDME